MTRIFWENWWDDSANHWSVWNEMTKGTFDSKKID